jgi:IMP dehydrogenase
MKTARQLIERKPGIVSIAPHESVFTALERMAEHDIGALVVLDGPVLAGVLSERDYARKVILHGKNSNELAVSEIMSEYLPRVSQQHSLEECMEIMTNHNIRYLPVFDADRYVGVISIIDVVKETILAQQDRIEHLQNYIHGAV